MEHVIANQNAAARAAPHVIGCIQLALEVAMKTDIKPGDRLRLTWNIPVKNYRG